MALKELVSECVLVPPQSLALPVGEQVGAVSKRDPLGVAAHDLPQRAHGVLDLDNRYLSPGREQNAANRLENAFVAVIAEGASVTYDMKKDPADKSAVGTSEMADAIIKRLK